MSLFLFLLSFSPFLNDLLPSIEFEPLIPNLAKQEFPSAQSFRKISKFIF
jgi:hypothetical protein